MRATSLGRPATSSGRRRRARGRADRRGHDDRKPTRPASCSRANAGRPRRARGVDDDVLQQIAEARFDRALVAAVDLEVVGDRSLLADLAVGLREDHARAASPYSARAASSSSSDFSRARRRPARARASARRAPPLVLDARAGQLRFARRAIDAQRSIASCARRSRRPRRRARRGALGLDAQIVALDVELGELLADARARAAACSIAWRSAVAALTAAKTSLRAARRRPRALRSRAARRVGASVRRERRAAPRALGARARAALARARARCAPARGAPRARAISAAIAAARAPASRPAAVERDLLLQAVDRELARVRRFARRGRRARRPRSARCAAARASLRLRRGAPRPPFALARVGQPRRAPLDRLAELR
jgi:hypothetical protein